MSPEIEGLAEQTLSGKPFRRRNGARASGPCDDFIEHLGDVYGVGFVEAINFQIGDLDSGEMNRRFVEKFDEVKEAETGLDVLDTVVDSEMTSFAFAVWGLVKLDQLVNYLDLKGPTLESLWLLDDVCDANTESLGKFVRVAARLSIASAGGRKKYEKHIPARTFVRSEWLEHRAAYDGNKSEFARIYSRRLAQEFGLKVTDRTIREIWLTDNPAASDMDG